MKENRFFKKLFLPFLLFITIAFSAQALEWPVGRPAILSLFGQRGENGIERGIVMEGNSTVRAAGDGIVLVTIEENRNMAGFPSTLGNVVFIAHSDGIVSIYGNLESAEAPAGNSRIETGAVIARTGRSAWQTRASGSEQEGRGVCIFQIADQRQNTLLNPLLLLPPVQDEIRPTIRGVTLVSQAGRSYNPEVSSSVAAGSYRVYVAVTDLYARDSPQFAPFRVSVAVNGREASSVSFDTISKKQNMLVPNAMPQYFDGSLPVYSDDGSIYAGNISLARGRSEVTISARDFAGNERAAAYLLQVE